MSTTNYATQNAPDLAERMADHSIMRGTGNAMPFGQSLPSLSDGMPIHLRLGWLGGVQLPHLCAVQALSMRHIKNSFYNAVKHHVSYFFIFFSDFFSPTVLCDIRQYFVVNRLNYFSLQKSSSVLSLRRTKFSPQTNSSHIGHFVNGHDAPIFLTYT